MKKFAHLTPKKTKKERRDTAIAASWTTRDGIDFCLRREPPSWVIYRGQRRWNGTPGERVGTISHPKEFVMNLEGKGYEITYRNKTLIP